MKIFQLSLVLLGLFLGSASGQASNPWWGGAYGSWLSEGYDQSYYNYGGNTYYTDVPTKSFINYPFYPYFGNEYFSNVPYNYQSPVYYGGAYYPYYPYYLPAGYAKGRYLSAYPNVHAFPYLQPNWTTTVDYARSTSSLRVYDGGSWRTI